MALTPENINWPNTAEEYRSWVRLLADESPAKTLSVCHCEHLARFFRDANRPIDGRGLPPSRFCKVRNFKDSQILYLSGYPSVSALADLGCKYRIPPEFFEQHLSFMENESDRKHSTRRRLLSQQHAVFQLSIPSIGSCANTDQVGYDAWIKMNEPLAHDMESYSHALRMGERWKPFDSIVRSLEFHDSFRFSIEQFVTLCMIHHPEDANKWTVVLWSDAGNDLSQSLGQPLLHSLRGARFRPVRCMQMPLYANPTQLVRPTSSDPVSPIGERGPDGGISGECDSNSFEMPQSLSLLCDYSLTLDPDEVPCDALYALNKLFLFYASAETQYLDMAASVLEAVISFQKSDEKKQTNARSVLLHNGRLLRHRRGHIRNLIQYLCGSNLEASTEPRATARANKALAWLRLDLDNLLAENEELTARYQEEISTITSEATFEDAQRGIVLSRSSHKFAAFAAIYAPMSFACSVFGMNFITVSHFGVGMALWMAVSAGLLLFSLAALFWNRDRVMRVIQSMASLQGRSAETSPSAQSSQHWLQTGDVLARV